MDGFTFAGVHSSALGCWYRPAAKARGDDMPDFEISDLNPESRDGGYYIGSRVRPREFDLDCYFEDVTEETLVGIYRWLRRDTAGRLIFDSKPFIYYDVILSKRISITLYDHAEDGGKKYSGTFTASFTCYEPFGKLLRLSYDDAATQRELICTGILPTRMMPEAPGVASRRFLLYNPGTERAHTILRLAGNVGDGMLIRNLTTGQRCKVIGLTESSLQEGAVLELDSAMGQTRIVFGDEVTMAFAMHDEGYLTLAPCTPFVRELEISHTEGSNIVTCAGGFVSHMKGQYLYLDGWKAIREVTDASTAILSEAAAGTGTTRTPIVTMNEIEVQGDGLALTRFEVEYTPRI